MRIVQCCALPALCACASKGSQAQTHHVKASASATGEGFGWGLAWDGNRLAAGAPGQYVCPDPDPDDLCLNGGAAYIHE